MAELDFAFLADFARTKSGSMDALSIGIDTLIVRVLPADHQLFLGMRLAFDRSDCGTPYRVEAIVQGTDGERLAEMRIDGTAVWPESEPPGNRVTAHAVIPLVLTLTSAGVHSVDIALDGRALKTITFQVVVR